MNLGRLLHTKFGQLLMSVVLGFGLASLFRKVCKERIYKFDNKCYKFNSKPGKCDPTKRIIDFSFHEETPDILRI